MDWSKLPIKRSKLNKSSSTKLNLVNNLMQSSHSIRETDRDNISEGNSPKKIRPKHEKNFENPLISNSIAKHGAFRLKQLRRVETNERSSYVSKNTIIL